MHEAACRSAARNEKKHKSAAQLRAHDHHKYSSEISVTTMVKHADA